MFSSSVLLRSFMATRNAHSLINGSGNELSIHKLFLNNGLRRTLKSSISSSSNICFKYPCKDRRLNSVNLSKNPVVCSVRYFFTNTKYSNQHSEDHHRKRQAHRIKSTLYYLAAVGVLTVGLSYAAVPLYRIFCQSYSYGGTTSTHGDGKDLSEIRKVKNRPITIKFNADRSAALQWNFRPQQHEIVVYPGETALAFYQAENNTPRPIDGISTYNVIPFEAGQYFNKIQCFCFEEQRLNPGETVELPVFFYIDPEWTEDPKMQYIDEILLSYTFFESKEMPNLNISNWAPHGFKPSKANTTEPA